MPTTLGPIGPSGISDRGWWGTAGTFSTATTPIWIGKYSSIGTKERSWSRFNGITIPQNSTITVARVFVMFNANNTGGPVYPKCRMVNQKTMPAAAKSAMSSFFNGKVFTSPANEVLNGWNGTTTSISNVNISTFFAGQFSLPYTVVFNTTDYVQALVTANNYSNESMMVFFYEPNLETKTMGTTFQIGIHRNSPLWPTLEITYTPPAVPELVDKTTYIFK